MAEQKRFRDARTTIRLDPEAYRKVAFMARSRGMASIASAINTVLRDGMGIRGNYPCILKAGDNDYLWIAPTGQYGTLTKPHFRRFLGGGLPIEGDGTWDDQFETMDEACEELGTEVCRQSLIGLVVADPEAFVKMYEAYGRR